jgi:hypothetical protein
MDLKIIAIQIAPWGKVTNYKCKDEDDNICFINPRYFTELEKVGVMEIGDILKIPDDSNCVKRYNPRTVIIEKYQK